jgi:hypothetical protein
VTASLLHVSSYVLTKSTAVWPTRAPSRLIADGGSHQAHADPVGLEYSMQRPDLRSSRSGRSWMIVGCCCCRSFIIWCVGCSV